MRFIFHPHMPLSSQRLGGKAAALSALEAKGFPIPPWFAILPEAFEVSVPAPERLALTTPAAVNPLLRPIRFHVAVDVSNEIEAALKPLCPDKGRVAVRSSASDEDSSEHSFAGQLDSFLFVDAKDVCSRVADVWRSGFSDRILAYRRENALPPTPQPPAVLVQRMVNADAAGVAFSADPVSGRRSVAIVSAVYGLGSGLVSGECDADSWQVLRNGTISSREIAEKKLAHRFSPTNVECVDAVAVPADLARQPALTDDQVKQVATLARKAERAFGRPQDIEWAYADGHLFLLQSRPITSLASIPDPEACKQLWDNSNIVESYSGVTTPLTFSFARSVYEEVYRQFCRIMRVPEKDIEAHHQTFRNMLGLIRGQIFYNLLNWYRVLALLPGFKANRRFMEQMMGVREGLPDDVVLQLSSSGFGDKLQDGVRLARVLGGLIAAHLRLERSIRRFYTRLDQALAPPKPELADMRADELAAYYRDLERQLLTHWDAPLVNDFFAMLFHGLLRKLTKQWCADQNDRLANELVRGQGVMISAEPAARLSTMAAMARTDQPFVTLLCDAPLPDILRALATHPEFNQEYQSYVDKFGDRCLEELKLESLTLHGNPLPFLRSVGQLARSEHVASKSAATTPADHEAEAKRALGWNPFRRAAFSWVLKNARSRVLYRENLRFERTRLFGRIRRIFLELGARLHAANLLENPRDILYLEFEEVLGFVAGTSTTTNLKQLVALRQQEFDEYRSGPPPDDRFETRGVVYQGNRFRGSSVAASASGEERKGTGCCPGVVRGPVRVIRDPRNAQLPSGSILVAERTDPGWILLFPFASGLLVERGSLLSHSAIVARELGIPAVVGISGLTEWLHDGDHVELDGASGVVRRITPAPETPSAQ